MADKDHGRDKDHGKNKDHGKSKHNGKDKHHGKDKDHGTTHTDPGPWKAQEYPGPGHETEAFRITNTWAKALLAWQERIWAMSAIMEAKLGVSDTAFADVLKAVRAGEHSPAVIKRILDKDEKQAKGRTPGVGLPSDVVGHPPDPPFDPPF